MPELLDDPGASPAAASAVVGRDVLLAALAEAVLAVPGVVRLEPTLSTGGPRVLLHPNPFDGLHVLVRAGLVDVDLNLATSTSHQARAVAHHVQDAVAGVLAAHGCTRGAVGVSVLTVEPTGDEPRNPAE